MLILLLQVGFGRWGRDPNICVTVQQRKMTHFTVTPGWIFSVSSGDLLTFLVFLAVALSCADFEIIIRLHNQIATHHRLHIYCVIEKNQKMNINYDMNMTKLILSLSYIKINNILEHTSNLRAPAIGIVN